MHDWALIYLDGKEIGKLDRRRGEKTVKLPATSQEQTLDILVEATGRVNFGEGIIDRKGITEAVWLCEEDQKTELENWLVYNFPVDYKFQKKHDFTKADKCNGPAWYRTTFTVDKPGDTFLDMSTWGKGMVWVNGKNLGRFWKIGPQQTLYMPGCWLKKGKNEIIVFDLETPASPTIKGLTRPILDDLRPEESLYHRKKGEAVVLQAADIVKEGTFEKGNNWQTIKFDQAKEARYFCIEALSSFRNDDMASIAELYILDENGKEIPRTEWSTAYADSEEVLSENSDGDKVFDLQESTFWHTAWSQDKTGFPHQLILDLGKTYTVSGFRYLPRPQKDAPAIIKDYRIYLRTQPFQMNKK